MKILLVSVNNEKEPYPVTPIGAAYVANALNRHGHSVNILDLCFVEDDAVAVEAALKNFKPAIVGLSIRNIDNLTYNNSIFYLPRIKGVVDKIKKLTSVPIVAGGSGFSIFPEGVLRYLGLELGIRGEGEYAFVLLADALDNAGAVYDIQNLCYLDDGGVYHANNVALSGFKGDPDRSLLDNKKYYDLGGMGNIQSKRGCPFKCSYCTYPNIEGDKLRPRDPDAVVDELKKAVVDYGIDYFFFVDDIFNIPESHALAICEGIIESELKIGWACFATPKGMTGELAVLMKRAGCRGIEFGSDAGAEVTLKELGKSFTPNDIAHAAECCKSINLPNAHYVIIAGPGETMATLQETFRFFKTIKPTAVIALTGLRIYPDTHLCAVALENGIIATDSDLLHPAFYMTPEIDAATVMKTVSEHAAGCGNWIVPGVDIGCDADMLTLLRKMGKKGPLWDIL
jgi:radical SAM superfamily enzyme YgiQ (UPF0313 family)